MNKWSLLFVFLSATVEAKDFSIQGPFSIRTQQPIYLQTVNLNPARAFSLSQGFLELRFDQAYSNLYERATDINSDVNLDTELYSLSVNAVYGVAPNWEVEIEIPFLRFEGGFLDSFIQNFHDFFGAPNGGREQVANGGYNFFVREGGGNYQIGQQSLNIGDLTLLSKYQWIEEEKGRPAVAGRAAIKLPSGNPDRGMGSGSPGFGLGAALEKSYKRFHSYLNLNYLMDGGNDLLPGLMHRNYFDYALALELSFSEKTSAIVQLNGGTPRLKGTGLETWDGFPMDLIVGVAGEQPLWDPNKTFFWKIAFSEDVTARGPSVDFTVFGSLGVRFPFRPSRIYKGDFFARRQSP